MSIDCEILGIPNHLHKNQRELDTIFDEEEVLYRRFKIERSKWEGTIQESSAVFELKDDSYNRSKYCLSPTDVLYSSTGEYYENWGIGSVSISKISGNKKSIINNEIRNFTIKVEHTPEICNYPHCEVFIYEDGIGKDKKNQLL